MLVYYGVGGIGKTSLRIELGRLLDEQHPKVVWAVLDFATPTHRNAEDALFWLRQELKRKYRVQFPSFDLAYAQFWQKSHPQISLRKENLPFLEENEFLAELIGIAEAIPGLTLIGKMPKLIEKVHGSVGDWWTKRGRQELYELQEMAPGEISARLPMFWAADLKDFMQRESQPVVLFIDTYEALWEGKRTEGRFFSQDEWVRELVTQLPEVLWVIAGQQKLRWEELKPDWGSHQQQHLVGGLAQSDAQRFLTSCGITGEAVQRAIVEGSKGVPSYLDLAVDTYLEIKAGQQRDPSPSDFRGTPQEVLERFLRYLDRSETETLKVLSVPRFWDRTLFKLLIEEFKTGYPVTALPELCRFSFIQEEQIPGTWTIHPLMREGLEEHQDAELRRDIHQYLFDHYKQQLQGLESTAISDLHKTALTEAFHHGKHVLATKGFFEWFTTIEEIFDHAALWQFLIPLYEEFARLMEDRLGSEHPDTALSLNNLAFLYKEQGRYEEAEPLYERALGIREKVLGSEHPDTTKSLNNLAELYRQQGRYGEAESLHERALRIWEKVLGPEHLDSTATSLNNLAVLYAEQGRYEEAESLHERALGILEKVLGSEHPNTAHSLNNLALLYKKQGRYEEAEPLDERALRIKEKALGVEHQDTATSAPSFVE